MAQISRTSASSLLCIAPMAHYRTMNCASAAKSVAAPQVRCRFDEAGYNVSAAGTVDAGNSVSLITQAGSANRMRILGGELDVR
jgi:hypothetical protein